MNNTLSPTIKVNLAPSLLEKTMFEAERIGISLQDFIRMLLGTYFAHAPSIRAISKDDELYEQAKDDIKNGKYIVVKDSAELREYFTHLKEKKQKNK